MATKNAMPLTFVSMELTKELSAFGLEEVLVCEARRGWGFPFSYSVAKKDGAWSSNIDHRIAPGPWPDRNAMIDAVSRHFEECISRALDVVKVKDQICGIASHLARLARCPEEQVLEIAAREAPEEIFKVRDLPWVETRSGNMMTAGGHGFPWPFIYLINRCEGGWEYDRNARGALDMEPGAAPVEPDRHRCSELQAAKDLVQSDFEIRINGLVRINLAQELLRDLLASAPTGVDGIAMCLQSYKTGTKRAISDGEAPGP